MKLCDFIITGTAAYGPQTPGKSDIDIVLMWDDARRLEQALLDKGIEIEYLKGRSPENGYPKGTFYFQIAGLRFNIVRIYTSDAFAWWKERTEYLKKIPPIADREERLREFKGLPLFEADDLGSLF